MKAKAAPPCHCEKVRAGRFGYRGDPAHMASGETKTLADLWCPAHRVYVPLPDRPPEGTTP